jgi:alanyl-tRNA synthetase
MRTHEVRQKYLDFFKIAPQNHQEIAPAPLVLKDDLSTLFTSAGMQPLVPYLMGKTHPQGKRLVDSQPCFRAKDIEEVGDNRHTTFFEMLGNWSLGDYFKKEQLPWLWEFLTRQLGLPKEKLSIGVFAGNSSVPKDEESKKIWLDLGVSPARIFEYGVDKNWWSVGGTPEEMAEGQIGGPDSEVFFEFSEIKHDPKFGKVCHPNCDCGRFLEIANSVFIEYRKTNGKLVELPQKNVDFGGGLERLTAAVNNDPDVFAIDVFQKIIREIEKKSGQAYADDKKSFRIIADHLRAAEALIKEDVEPGNKLQGYVLRRLIRRAAVKMRKLKGSLGANDLSFNEDEKVAKVIESEVAKFGRTLDKGLKLVGKASPFELFQTYGFPVEITEELLAEKGQKIDKEAFGQQLKKHQEISRIWASKK